MKIFCITAMIAAVLLIVWFIIENVFILNIRREDFGGDIRVAHISDIHRRRMGRNNSRISRITAAEKPDIIVITGDLVSRYDTEFDEASAFVDELCKIAPVYMCLGNHEQSLKEDVYPKFLEIIGKKPMLKLLMNESVRVNIKGRDIIIYGMYNKYTVYKKDDGYSHLDGFELSEMRELLGDAPNEETFLLSHNPFFGEVYAEWGADYTFSGHVHGGAVRLFGIGILSPERRFFPKYSKGVFTLSKKNRGGKNPEMKLLVSGGIGKLRLFNPPEVVIYII